MEKRAAVRIQSYRDLEVWRIAIELTCEVYRLTASFPRAELYALTDQLRRASVSVASCIAEGHGGGTRKEYKRLVCKARGSALEIEVQLLIAELVGYVTAAELEKARGYCDSISRMLTNLRRALERQPKGREKEEEAER